MSRTQTAVILGTAAALLAAPGFVTAQQLPCMSIGLPSSNERAYALVEDITGSTPGYVMAGYTDTIGNHDALVVKTDTNGIPVWTRMTCVFPDSNAFDDEATSMVASALDGTPGYVVTGWTRNTYTPGPPGQSDVFLAKFDGNGNVLWAWRYGASTVEDEQAFSVAEVTHPSDPGYVITGWANHMGTRHAFVMKTSPTGLLQNTVYYDFVPSMPWNDEGYSIVEVSTPSSMNPEYAFCGRAQTTANLDYDAFVVKLNYLLQPQWSRFIWGAPPSFLRDDEAYSIVYNDSLNHIALAGWTQSFMFPTAPAPDTNIFVWEIDQAGNTMWLNIYGWYGDEERAMDDRSLIYDPADDNYVVSGWTNSVGPSAPNSDFLTMKLSWALAGTVVWARVHPSSYQPDPGTSRAYPMIPDTRTSGFAIAGYNSTFAPGLEDMHLVTLDAAGWREPCVDSVEPLACPIAETTEAIYAYVEPLTTYPYAFESTYVEYDSICYDTTPPQRDVGAFIITVPADTVDTLTMYAPVCSLYNYGDSTETYTVTMRIGSFYSDTDTVTGHASHTAVAHTFASYSNWPRGMQAMSCSTELSIDTNNGNDRVVDSVFGRVRDVGCVQIVQPSGTIDSGTSVVPACSLDNFGNVAVGYNVRMKIGSPAFYNTIVNVPSHAAGNRIGVSLPQWVATQVGTHPVTCSTELAVDVVTGNDKATGSVTVRVPGGHDVACVEIFAPTGQTDSGTVITPACSVYNYGGSAETFNVRMKIGAAYNMTSSVAGLAAGSGVRVSFTNWPAGPVGNLAVTCSTELATDDTPANDRHTDQVLVRRVGPDVGCTVIVEPAGNYVNGTVVTPRCSVYNYGNTTPTYNVRLQIGAGYDMTASVSAHLPGTTREVTFPTWTADPNGSHAVKAFPILVGDVAAVNDTATASCTVGPGWPTGWHEVTPMPLTPSSKPVKRGGWLVYNDDNEHIYAGKGYKTNDFYVYSPANNTWSHLVGMPYTAHPLWYKKAPRKGSKGVYDGVNYIYVTQGNNSLGFWRYSVADDSWEILEDVPYGTTRKKVKGGTDMAFVVRNDTGYVYLLKGYKTEFYRYNTRSNSWESRYNAPTGHRAKWDKGSWLCVEDEGADVIYAHKAKYNELYAYYIDADTWSSDTTLTGMPFIGATGRRKKSKDGGSAAWYSNAMYALKGGNTGEFWRYDVGTDAWTELDSVPSYGSTGRKKRVKYGADIVTVGNGAFFALKGNKTVEMWRYVLATPMAHGGTPRAGIMARPAKIGGCRLTVAPNPLSGGFVTLRYGLPTAGPATVSVFDATGRMAARQSLVVSRDGCSTLDLRSLSAGVYLVRLEADGYSASRKLVVQR